MSYCHNKNIRVVDREEVTISHLYIFVVDTIRGVKNSWSTKSSKGSAPSIGGGGGQRLNSDEEVEE